MTAGTDVAGVCPMGCGATLFLGDGGHVTCSLGSCRRPSAADELLHLDADHIVHVGDRHFTIEHPTRERIEGTMHECPVYTWMASHIAAPAPEGRYRVLATTDGCTLEPVEGVS